MKNKTYFRRSPITTTATGARTTNQSKWQSIIGERYINAIPSEIPRIISELSTRNYIQGKAPVGNYRDETSIIL